MLTERQALEALLLPSADNVAWILARWDAGSAAAFVDRMNAVAHQLGMTSTRYTDPSGLAASTTSSAADQVRLGIAAMGQPALAGIASQSSALIPVAGTVDNLNSLLGEDGIVGLKTGSTSAAGGCALLGGTLQDRPSPSAVCRGRVWPAREPRHDPLGRSARRPAAADRYRTQYRRSALVYPARPAKEIGAGDPTPRTSIRVP